MLPKKTKTKNCSLHAYYTTGIETQKKGWERGERGERAPPVYPRNHHQKSTLIQSSENP